MATPVWRGFIVNQSENEFTVISERDKQYHIVPGQVRSGNVIMPDGHCCCIDEYIFNPSMLFSACREYVYDLRRHKKRRTKNKETLKEN
jgi:hypothetical protein